MEIKQKFLKNIRHAVASYGYDLTPQWRLESQPLARHLRKVFDHYQIDCVLDVGANKGQYRDFLREEVRYAGRIISFEPVKKYVDLLKSRAEEDASWTIVDHALGRDEATAEINVTKSPGLNSFLEPRHDAVEGFWDKETIVKESVVIKRLDDVFSGLQTRFGFQKPYVKLDTQGFDLEVVAGGMQALSSASGLQTEASIKPIYTSMPNYRQTIETMEGLGFQLSGMFPVTHDDALRLIEFDCVMVR